MDARTDITPQFTVDDNPQAVLDAQIYQGLSEYNGMALGRALTHFSVYLHDQHQQLRGGALATVALDSIFLRTLWVDQVLRRRGYGAEILARVEQHAKTIHAHCIIADTFTFQSVAFYLQRGYYQVAEVKQFVQHYDRVTVRKDLI